jgi:DNA-directed RNA polymerase specialized sigma24 family protein/transposase
MCPVYHTTSVFPPTTMPNREQFNTWLQLNGRRLERYIHSRLWYLNADPDDMEDAIQSAFIRLWNLYQKQPSVIEMEDGWWLQIGYRAAQNGLQHLMFQRGMKTAKGLKRLEFNASRLESDGTEYNGLEMLEVKHFRHEKQPRRAESEQVDRLIDVERLIAEALNLLNYRQREALKLIIPLIAQGYAINEAARHTAIGRGRAQRVWDAFQHACEEISGQVRDAMKGKGTPARADELEQIRVLANLGLSCSAIAKQIGRSKFFVKEKFERATGYRRGSNNQRNPITPQRVEQMKTLKAQGLGIVAIAKTVGCSTGSVHAWLNR